MPRERYAREKLAVAMDCLATSAAPLQARLANAALSALIRLEAEDFVDGEARELFASVMTRLQAAEPSGPRGAIEMSANGLTDAEAEAVAREIANLHGLVMPPA